MLELYPQQKPTLGNVGDQFLFPGYYFMNSMLQSKARIQSFKRLCLAKDKRLPFAPAELEAVATKRNDFIGKEL